MFSRRAFVALVALLALNSTAWAGGGGGTKKDATISVRNDSSIGIAAFIDPTPAAMNATTQAQVEAAGGQVILPGQTKSFKVRAGTYVLAVGSTETNPITTNVSIGKGQTRRYAYTNNNTLASF